MFPSSIWYSTTFLLLKVLNNLYLHFYVFFQRDTALPLAGSNSRTFFFHESFTRKRVLWDMHIHHSLSTEPLKIECAKYIFRSCLKWPLSNWEGFYFSFSLYYFFLWSWPPHKQNKSIALFKIFLWRWCQVICQKTGIASFAVHGIHWDHSSASSEHKKKEII